jgi:hypothetical protein
VPTLMALRPDWPQPNDLCLIRAMQAPAFGSVESMT